MGPFSRDYSINFMHIMYTYNNYVGGGAFDVSPVPGHPILDRVSQGSVLGLYWH